MADYLKFTNDNDPPINSYKMSKVRLMRNFDDIPDIIVEKKTYEPSEPPMNAISVSRKGVFTFNATLKKNLIDSSKSKNIWAVIRDVEGELYIRVVSSDPKKDNAAKINKKTGIFSAKIVLNNAKSIPNLQSHLSGKNTKTIRFEEKGDNPRKINLPSLEVDSSNKTVMLDTNTMRSNIESENRLRF